MGVKRLWLANEANLHIRIANAIARFVSSLLQNVTAS